MMSILIKGMEMPISCWACPLSHISQSMDCFLTCEALGEDAEEDDGRLKNCPLIEVPPHGRLIDADALDIRRREQQAWQDYEYNPDNEYLEGVKDGLHEASKQISTAMTIIEAEGT